MRQINNLRFSLTQKGIDIKYVSSRVSLGGQTIISAKNVTQD